MLQRTGPRLIAALLALGLAQGCAKSEDSAASAPAAAPSVAKKTIDQSIEGTAATLPAVFKGLSLGMTKAEAEKAVPALAQKKYLEDPAFDGVRFQVSFDKKTERLTRVYFSVPKTFAATLTKAWGAPTDCVDSIKKPEQFWFNPKAGLRAALKEGFGDESTLEFTAYLPVAEFVGDKTQPAFAFEAKTPILGATIEALRAAYPDAIVEKNQAEAEADRKRVEAMAGKKLDVLGKAKPSAHLDFKPTEFESYWSRVNLTFDDEGKVSRYRFSLPYRAHPAAKEPHFKLLEAKFGAPTEEEYLGTKRFIFPSDAFRVEVREDGISHAWDVTIEPKKG